MIFPIYFAPALPLNSVSAISKVDGIRKIHMISQLGYSPRLRHSIINFAPQAAAQPESGAVAPNTNGAV
jgi:hypothetical protein